MKYVYELEINNLKLNNTIVKTAYVDVIMSINDSNYLHIDVDLYVAGALTADYIKLYDLYSYLHNTTLYCYLLKIYMYNDSIIVDDEQVDIVKMLTHKCDYSYN